MKKAASVAREPESVAPVTDVAQLLAKVAFSADNVVDAAAHNPVLFVQAIEFRLHCMRRRSEEKMRYERAQAERELQLRQDARETGERLTERNVEALLLTDDCVSAHMRNYNAAEEMDEYSKLVVEAFRIRRDCLKIVGDLTRDELGLQRAAEAGVAKMREARTKLPGRFPAGE